MFIKLETVIELSRQKMKNFKGNFNLQSSLALVALFLAVFCFLAISGANYEEKHRPLRQPLLERMRLYRSRRQTDDTTLSPACNNSHVDDYCSSEYTLVNIKVCQGRRGERTEGIDTYTCTGQCHTLWEYGRGQTCKCCFPYRITSAVRAFDCRDGTTDTIHYATSAECLCYGCLERNRHIPHTHLHSSFH